MSANQYVHHSGRRRQASNLSLGSRSKFKRRGYIDRRVTEGRPHYRTFEEVFRRSRYYPAYGDAKDRQGIASASKYQFGRDLTDEILAREWHRSERTGSPNRPSQPRRDARLKTWRQFARAEGRLDLYADLNAQVKAFRRSRRNPDPTE